MVKFFPYYNNVEVKGSNIKFKRRLCPEIMQGIRYQEILRFPMLVNKCRIYDEDIKAQSSHCKSLYDKKGKNPNHGKSYSAPTDKEKHKASYEKRPSGGRDSRFYQVL